MFHLSIDKPCQENRDNFLKTKNGGFCSSCQKEVIDFTKMTDQEVRDYFKYKANRNTCGMLKNSQLKTYYPEQYKKQSLWIGATILGGILSFFPMAGKSQTANSFDIHQTEQTPPSKELPAVYDSLTLSGIVYSIEDGSALPGVNVILKGTKIGAVTDIDGKYSFE
ncbi:MAG: carboxypeptidase-like regulatory domain-containing protein, partial [Bacteroidota bacterium]